MSYYSYLIGLLGAVVLVTIDDFISKISGIGYYSYIALIPILVIYSINTDRLFDEEEKGN